MAVTACTIPFMKLICFNALNICNSRITILKGPFPDHMHIILFLWHSSQICTKQAYFSIFYWFWCCICELCMIYCIIFVDMHKSTIQWLFHQRNEFAIIILHINIMYLKASIDVKISTFTKINAKMTRLRITKWTLGWLHEQVNMSFIFHLFSTPVPWFCFCVLKDHGKSRYPLLMRVVGIREDIVAFPPCTSSDRIFLYRWSCGSLVTKPTQNVRLGQLLILN